MDFLITIIEFNTKCEINFDKPKLINQKSQKFIFKSYVSVK